MRKLPKSDGPFSGWEHPEKKVVRADNMIQAALIKLLTIGNQTINVLSETSYVIRTPFYSFFLFLPF